MKGSLESPLAWGGMKVEGATSWSFVATRQVDFCYAQVLFSKEKRFFLVFPKGRVVLGGGGGGGRTLPQN